ncbi:MAG: prolipoprotein diacylglyceryl transferase [Lawsonibacter sp.]|nr:prolipoprotein diacylglyceryl transferase [Lawsonibacter sp.]
MINTVSFPGLGLEFTLNRVAFTIPVLDLPVYWYGVIITCGLILAVYLCSRWGKRFGITEDNIIDMMLFAVPAALVAIRVYYVVFNLDMYRQADGSLNWGRILNYGDGGLAIYGAIISSAIVLLIFCRKKKLSFLAYADLGVHGLFIGQLIGRWGNFMNVEAYGSATALPWRMCGPSIAAEMLQNGYVDQTGYEAILSGALGVHPTFFYESAWNLVGLIVVYWVGKRRRFDGECFLFYFFWYGLGRAWIEGLRTDSLYLFGWELFGVPIRVSQLLAAVTCVLAGGTLAWALWKYRGGKKELFVERRATQAAQDAGSGEEE